MECILFSPQQQTLILPPNLMINPLSSISAKIKLKPKTLLTKSIKLPQFCTKSHQLENPSELIQSPNKKPNTISRDKIEIIKQNWLFSLSHSKKVSELEKCESKWVVGVDPDVSGALAVLKSDNSGIISAEVFDSPFVQVSVGKRLRKRLDARSIVQLVQSFDAPTGTVAYLEQSIPFPRDGKQI
ncbi:hypothetical protein RND81_04G238600 [Saponaria officinalis]|uniref:Uncharacterized protein n=1 Tax=Saponaria officinalis TaxID=3572 RepID=A0AAW1LPF4_SAPOF